MSKRLGPVIFAVALTACGGADSGVSSASQAPAVVTAPPTVAARPPAEVTIEGADLTLKGAEALTAGWTKFTVANDGPQTRGATLVRLRDGTTVAALEAAAKQGFEQMLSLVTAVGGPTAGAGKTVAMLVDLPAGQYAFVGAKGIVRPLTVQAAAGAPTSAPRADATVILRDFLFDMPDSLPSGKRMVNVPNMGQQLHELGIGRLSAGKTAADLTAYLSKPAGPPPLDLIASVSTIPAGGVAVLSLDLEPGQYYALCFLPDPASRKPHVALGMMREFTVK